MATILDTQKRIAFVLAYKNVKYHVMVDPILRRVGLDTIFDGKYWVEVKDEANNFFLVFYRSKESNKWITYFNTSLHHDVITCIGEQITKSIN